jgi:hypothetical protein
MENLKEPKELNSLTPAYSLKITQGLSPLLKSTFPKRMVQAKPADCIGYLS